MKDVTYEKHLEKARQAFLAVVVREGQTDNRLKAVLLGPAALLQKLLGTEGERMQVKAHHLWELLERWDRLQLIRNSEYQSLKAHLRRLQLRTIPCDAALEKLA